MGTRAKFDLQLSPETKLERHVARWLREQARDSYDGEIRGVARDVMHGGCASGTVGHLIYTRACVAFYRAHRVEIHAILAEMLDSMGVTCPAELFGDKWDASDWSAAEDSNQNLLAWFGFEEACRTVVSRAGVRAVTGKVVVFAVLATLFMYAALATSFDDVPAPPPDWEPDRIGASYRARNVAASEQCAGSVSDRRRCWLEWPVAE